MIAACVVLVALFTQGLHAQSFFLTLTNTPDPILVGSNITYRLTVSNATGFNLNPGVITSEYNNNAEFVRATNLFGFTNSTGLVVFAIPASSFPANGVIQVLLELRGTNVGQLTNKFRVEIDDDGRTTPAETNALSSIELPLVADLGISVQGPANGVFPGDEFQYSLIATNAGPGNAQGVVVSNPVPANISLLSFNPSNQVNLSGTQIVFSVGTLTNAATATAKVSVLATNAATTNLISAKISSNGANATNASTVLNVPILTPITNQIVEVNRSGQTLNPQTGWMEQQVVLRNTGTTAVESVRLLVEGLTNQLVNATGTNGLTPYVAAATPLAPGGQVEFVLEYDNPSRLPGLEPSLNAYGTPPLVSPPLTGTNVAIDRILPIQGGLNAGRVLLEWPAQTGQQFQVIYSHSPISGTGSGSLPIVFTPSSANRIQWLDYGPPRTSTNPTETTSRFYRVIQLP